MRYILGDEQDISHVHWPPANPVQEKHHGSIYQSGLPHGHTLDFRYAKTAGQNYQTIALNISANQTQKFNTRQTRGRAIRSKVIWEHVEMGQEGKGLQGLDRWERAKV